MKSLSLLQPWASLVAIGAKRIETRSWQREYRGPLAIHASARMTSEGRWLCWQPPFIKPLSKAGLLQASRDGKYAFRYLFPLGAVIATCNLVDCLEIMDWHFEGSMEQSMPCAELKSGKKIRGNEYAFGDYTPGRYAWMLEDVRMLPEPIPAKGQLGLWNWEPPEGVPL